MREVLKRARCLFVFGASFLASLAGLTATSAVAGALAAPTQTIYSDESPAEPVDADSCPVAENGFTGILHVDFIVYDSPAFGGTVLIASDEEYAQISRKLACNQDGTGLVKLEGAAEWTLSLSLATDGRRLSGQCALNNRRIFVMSRTQAASWL